MTNLFHDIPAKTGDDFHAVIEIPKNSRIKYEYNEDYGRIFVDRVFKLPMGYPQNYGFFPKTWNKYDKDPMDVIILSEEIFHPAVIVPVRIVGIIEMEDTGELDHKILAVPVDEARQNHINDLDDLHKEDLENLVWFLENYKAREKGKKVKILGTKNRENALEFMNECIEEYKTKHN